MRGEIDYLSKTFGECPSDYDYKTIKDLNELKFLKFMDILQSKCVRLKYNIEMFDNFFNLYLFNSAVKQNLNGFLILLLSNLSTVISIDFSCLIHEENEINIDSLKSLCQKNPLIFKNVVINDILKSTKKSTNIAKKLYSNYFNTLRKQIFAHSDEILLNNNDVAKLTDKVTVEIMKELLKHITDILSTIWFAYNNQKLCFTLKSGNDYKKLIEIVCSQLENNDV